MLQLYEEDKLSLRSILKNEYPWIKRDFSDASFDVIPGLMVNEIDFDKLCNLRNNLISERFDVYIQHRFRFYTERALNVRNTHNEEYSLYLKILTELPSTLPGTSKYIDYMACLEYFDKTYPEFDKNYVYSRVSLKYVESLPGFDEYLRGAAILYYKIIVPDRSIYDFPKLLRDAGIDPRWSCIARESWNGFNFNRSETEDLISIYRITCHDFQIKVFNGDVIRNDILMQAYRIQQNMFRYKEKLPFIDKSLLNDSYFSFKANKVKDQLFIREADEHKMSLFAGELLDTLYEVSEEDKNPEEYKRRLLLICPGMDASKVIEYFFHEMRYGHRSKIFMKIEWYEL